MGFSHIQKNKQRLISRSLTNPRINPFELPFQAPGITREMKVLKPAAQLKSGFSFRVEPLHRTTANGGVTTPTKTLNNVGSIQQKAVTVLPSGA